MESELCSPIVSQAEKRSRSPLRRAPWEQPKTSAVPPLASACIQCWALLLGGYDYTISYKPRQLHNNTDMLSWLLSAPAPPSTLSTPKTVLLMDTFYSGPVTVAQIRLWSTKDIVLAKVIVGPASQESRKRKTKRED